MLISFLLFSKIKIKNYGQINIDKNNSVFERNKCICLYLLFNIYNNIEQTEKGQKICEQLDINSEEKFKQIVCKQIYYNVYNIKIELLKTVNKKNNYTPLYTNSDFSDSNEIAVIATCNSLLNFIGCFEKK